MILFLCAPAVLINLDKVCIKMIQKSLWSIVMNIFCWASAWACKEVSNRQSIHDRGRATWNCLALPQLLVTCEEIRPLLGWSYPLPARSIPARKLQTWVGIVCTVQCIPPVLIILVHSVVIFYYCIKWSVWARCSLCIMWRETISSEMNKLGVMIKVIDDISYLMIWA